MIRRLFVFLYLMTSIIGLTPADLFGGDPPVGVDPGDIFGDPDDEFKPADYGLTNDLSTGDTTSGSLRQKGVVGPDRWKDSLVNFWIRIPPDRFEK